MLPSSGTCVLSSFHQCLHYLQFAPFLLGRLLLSKKPRFNNLSTTRTSSHQYLRNVLRPDRTLKFTYSHTRLRKKHTDNLASFLLRPWLLAPDALSCRILQHGGLQRSLPPPKGGRRSPLVDYTVT